MNSDWSLHMSIRGFLPKWAGLEQNHWWWKSNVRLLVRSSTTTAGRTHHPFMVKSRYSILFPTSFFVTLLGNSKCVNSFPSSDGCRWAWERKPEWISIIRKSMSQVNPDFSHQELKSLALRFRSEGAGHGKDLSSTDDQSPETHSKNRIHWTVEQNRTNQKRELIYLHKTNTLNVWNLLEKRADSVNATKQRHIYFSLHYS